MERVDQPEKKKVVGFIPTDDQLAFLKKKKKETGIGYSNVLRQLLADKMQEEAERQRAS